MIQTILQEITLQIIHKYPFNLVSSIYHREEGGGERRRKRDNSNDLLMEGTQTYGMHN